MSKVQRTSGPSHVLWPASDWRVKLVMQALEGQPRLRASQLAAMVELSPDHLERLFKKQAGASIGNYSMELRLQAGRTLLRGTFRPLKDICHEVGIPDPSNFVRRFKQRFGLTPSAYRRASNVGFDQ